MQDDLPFSIEHGTKDQLIPTQQSVQFAEKPEKTLGKNKVKLVLLQGARHGGSQNETNENLEIIFNFLVAF